MSALFQLGLIGNPLKHSQSDKIHNAYFKRCKIPAVYSKYELLPKELAFFLEKAKHICMLGLSVTMPFKETILSYLEDIDPVAQAIGAVNTVLFREQKAIRYNTDGIGALNALESALKSSVAQKKILLLGAGGAAKAIAYEAVHRNAKVTILNRTLEKAKTLAERVSCDYATLAHAHLIKQFDILIHATPVGMLHSVSLVQPETLNPKTLVFDILTHPEETTLLKLAAQRGCQVLHGRAMWEEQAQAQYRIWFEGLPDFSSGRIIS